MSCNNSHFQNFTFERHGCVPVMDHSNKIYPNDIKIVPTWEVVVKCLVYSVIIIIALFGNIAVICVVIFNKNMRSTTNIYIANLAAGDFLMASCPMWIQMVESVTTQWYFGEFLCKLFPLFQVTTMCCSIFTMTAIACDRFFAVVFPLKSRSTQRNVTVIIIIIWIISLALGIPSFFAFQFRKRQWKNHFESFCNEEFAWLLCDVDDLCEFNRLQTLYKKAYWTFVCAVANWLPMLIMQVGYFAIAIILYKRNHYTSHDPSLCNNGEITVQERSFKKVLKMVFVLLVVFMICWVPFQIELVYSLYRADAGKRVSKWFESFQIGSLMLAHANSALNPLLYAGLNESFRKGFVRVFCCWRKRHFQHRPSTQSYTRTSIVSQTTANNCERRKIKDHSETLLTLNQKSDNGEIIALKDCDTPL